MTFSLPSPSSPPNLDVKNFWSNLQLNYVGSTCKSKSVQTESKQSNCFSNDPVDDLTDYQIFVVQ